MNRKKFLFAAGAAVFGLARGRLPAPELPAAAPAPVSWALMPEGNFLHLDGGKLELGLVRDSVLNATHDYQVFGETFEKVAGDEWNHLWVTSSAA